MAQLGVRVEAARGIVEASGNTTTQFAATSAAMAVLQADGAVPTEAHVDTADAALIAALLADDAGVVVRIPSTITRAQLKVALDAAFRYFAESIRAVV